MRFESHGESTCSLGIPVGNERVQRIPMKKLWVGLELLSVASIVMGPKTSSGLDILPQWGFPSILQPIVYHLLLSLETDDRVKHTAPQSGSWYQMAKFVRSCPSDVLFTFLYSYSDFNIYMYVCAYVVFAN